MRLSRQQRASLKQNAKVAKANKEIIEECKFLEETSKLRYTALKLHLEVNAKRNHEKIMIILNCLLIYSFLCLAVFLGIMYAKDVMVALKLLAVGVTLSFPWALLILIGIIKTTVDANEEEGK